MITENTNTEDLLGFGQMDKLTWLTILSVTPVLSCPRFGAIESNSSKNKRHGAAAAAFENISRTWK